MKKNIILSLKNITGHLTGAKKIITLCFLISTLCFFNSDDSSALTYQQDIPVSFTFNSSVVLTLSSADLNIYNLSPGTSSDSNIIRVTATSNNSTGYVITATVGDNTHSNPSYSNTSLNHISNTGNIFSSIATNADLASLTNDNTWGYAISDNGSTWSNYSGLPLYTAESGKTLKELNTNGTTSFDFKIAAKASSSQPSGEYRNVINFTLTSNAVPITPPTSCPVPAPGLTYMQDLNVSSASVREILNNLSEGYQYYLADSRDNKTYCISKLADGNLWMTQNLDHDIDSSRTYTRDDTNVYEDWTPTRSTYPTTSTQFVSNWCTGGTFSSNGMCSSNDSPESYDPGNLYWNGAFDSDGVWENYFRYCSGSSIADTVCDWSLNPLSNGALASSSGNSHYHLGNYYNWAAALATNDSSVYTGSSDAPTSICPAGWVLPRSNISRYSFWGLWQSYGYTRSTSSFADISAAWSDPLYYAPSGVLTPMLQDIGIAGDFWTSTSNGANSASAGHIDAANTNVRESHYDNPRSFGTPVRCMVLGDGGLS